MVEKVRGKLFVTLLLAFLLCCGISAIGATSGAAAEEGAAAAVPVIEIEGAAVRYPDEDETVYVGTGLRFSAKLTGVEDVGTIQDLGVLVNTEGMPTIENTPTEGVGVNIEYIKDGAISKEHKYVEEDGGLCMRVALTHIPANYFHHEFVCRAYYRLNGGAIVYSDVMERSVTHVIKAAIDDISENAPSDEQKAALKELRAASSDHTAEIALGVGEVIEPATDTEQGSKKAFCACGAEVSTPVGLYRYTFDTKGGSEVEAIAAYSYDTVKLPDDVTKDGAKFLGWYDANGNKIETVNVPYENKTGVEVTFTAKWLEYVTEKELVAGYDFDSEEAVARAVPNNPATQISYDAGRGAMAVSQAGSGEERLTRLSGLIDLQAGDKVVLNIDNYSATDNNGGSLRIMNANDTPSEKIGIAKEEGFGYYAWTATKAYENVYIGYIHYTSNTYYIKSLQVVRKQVLSADQLEAGVAFNAVESLGYLTANQYAVPAVYDDAQNAVKIAPKEANQTVSVNIERFTLNAGDRIAVCALSAINVGFLVSGDWKMNLTEEGGTAFKNYVWTADETTVVNSMEIMPYTSKGELYIRSIQVIRKQNLTAEQLEAGVNFDSVAALGFVSCNEGDFTLTYDETLSAVKIAKPREQNLFVFINVETFTLNAGDQIVVRALGAVNVGFYVSGDWKINLTINGTEFTETVWEAEETITVTGMATKLYATSGEYYVQSIRVFRAPTGA